MKNHTAAARSTFPSQNAQKTKVSDHFCKKSFSKITLQWHEVKQFKNRCSKTTFGRSVVEKVNTSTNTLTLTIQPRQLQQLQLLQLHKKKNNNYHYYDDSYHYCKYVHNIYINIYNNNFTTSHFIQQSWAR